MLDHQLVLRILQRLEITSRTSAAVMCDAEDPCSANTAYEQESSFATSPRSTKRPLYFGELLDQV